MILYIYWVYLMLGISAIVAIESLYWYFKSFLTSPAKNDTLNTIKKGATSVAPFFYSSYFFMFLSYPKKNFTIK